MTATAEKQAEKLSPAKMSGAMLVAKLRESKTGKEKLDIANGVLRKTGGKATAWDVVNELMKELGPAHVTVEKARQFAAAGEYKGLEREEEKPVEMEFMTAEEKAFIAAQEAAKQNQKAADQSRTAPADGVQAVELKPVNRPAPEKAADVKAPEKAAASANAK